MKSFITILFILLYGLALIRPAVPLIDYFVKLEEYKAKCTNKSRPEMHCNGQCILMQRLQALELEKGSNPLTPPPPAKINMEDYPLSLILLPLKLEAISVNNALDYLNEQSPSPKNKIASEIFHPPLM